MSNQSEQPQCETKVNRVFQKQVMKGGLMMNSDERAKSIIDYYNDFNEKDRLKSTYGKLEFSHMTELLARYFPETPAKICDIGGAAGEYAFHFAKLGYDVHLLDIVPRHIEQAKERAISENGVNTDNFIVGMP